MPGVVEWLCAVGQPLPLVVRQYLSASYFIWTSPMVWATIVGLFAWERMRPVEPRPLLSRGLAQDFLWFNMEVMLRFTVLPVSAAAISWLYDTCLGGQRFELSRGWPTLLVIPLTLLMVDFLFYLKHRCFHGARGLWHFHAVHHSQRELNVLTDRRQHFLEYAAAQAMVFFPLTVLGLSPNAIMGSATVLALQNLLVHANIRTNLGWLGWFFVSPQFHRIHHSIEPRHYDKNFGGHFTIWDRMFGTHYPSTDEYPDTGVKNLEFAPPNTWNPFAWLADFARQLWYPFGKILPFSRGQRS